MLHPWHVNVKSTGILSHEFLLMLQLFNLAIQSIAKAFRKLDSVNTYPQWLDILEKQAQFFKLSHFRCERGINANTLSNRNRYSQLHLTCNRNLQTSTAQLETQAPFEAKSSDFSRSLAALLSR